jgi:hypothetical protein
MKFFALAALIGATSASQTAAKVELRSEMKSLLTLVKTVDSRNKEAVFSVIDTRKNELKALAVAMPSRKASILNELNNLKAIVQTVDQDNFDGAMEELTVRKNELMSIHKDLLNMEDAELTPEQKE